MSDFPKGGDIKATRRWLDGEGFQGLFMNWKADALLGLERADILGRFENEEEGLRLLGFLNTARQFSM